MPHPDRTGDSGKGVKRDVGAAHRRMLRLPLVREFDGTRNIFHEATGPHASRPANAVKPVRSRAAFRSGEQTQCSRTQSKTYPNSAVHGHHLW